MHTTQTDWERARNIIRSQRVRDPFFVRTLPDPRPGPVDLPGVVLRDLPVVQAVVLLTAGIVIAVNLLVDIIYAYLDPRIRYE